MTLARFVISGEHKPRIDDFQVVPFLFTSILPGISNTCLTSSRDLDMVPSRGLLPEMILKGPYDGI